MRTSAADEAMGSADCRIIFTPHTEETKPFFSPSVLSLHHIHSLQRHHFVRRLSSDEYLHPSSAKILSFSTGIENGENNAKVMGLFPNV